MLKKVPSVVLCLMLVAPLYATDNTFYVYSDSHARGNHYAPSGWMGDYGDIKYNESDTTNPKSGKSVIKITYTAEGKQGNNWAGIYWQYPANNWGNKGPGLNLSGYKRLTLWARGEKGGELLDKFCVGGITGESMDSGSSEIGPVTLTTEWQQYTIDLKGQDLKSINGALCWAANRDNNPHGLTMYLDEIRFEK